jgi:hypothetical protein
MDKNILNYIFSTLLNFKIESNTKKINKLSKKKKDYIEGFQTDEEDIEPKNEEPKNEEPKNEEPKKEEPKKEEPKKEEPKDDDEEPKNIKKEESEEKSKKPKKVKKVKKGKKKLCLGKTCIVETDLKKILESIQDK